MPGKQINAQWVIQRRCATDDQPTDWWALIECSLILALLIYVMYLIPA